MKTIYSWFGGRHTFFALFFAMFGSIMAWYGKLDTTYIAFIGAVQGLVLAHSYKEDKMNSNGGGGNAS